MGRVEVIMPQMGESIAEGTIIRWHKKVGEQVKKDETLLEISTDKVDSEIPSPASGVLAEITVQEQVTVPVQTVIAYLETEGKEAAAAQRPEAEAGEPQGHLRRLLPRRLPQHVSPRSCQVPGASSLPWCSVSPGKRGSLWRS